MRLFDKSKPGRRWRYDKSTGTEDEQSVVTEAEFLSSLKNTWTFKTRKVTCDESRTNKSESICVKPNVRMRCAHQIKQQREKTINKGWIQKKTKPFNPLQRGIVKRHIAEHINKRSKYKRVEESDDCLEEVRNRRSEMENVGKMKRTKHKLEWYWGNRLRINSRHR